MVSSKIIMNCWYNARFLWNYRSSYEWVQLYSWNTICEVINKKGSYMTCVNYREQWINDAIVIQWAVSDSCALLCSCHNRWDAFVMTAILTSIQVVERTALICFRWQCSLNRRRTRRGTHTSRRLSSVHAVPLSSMYRLAHATTVLQRSLPWRQWGFDWKWGS